MTTLQNSLHQAYLHIKYPSDGDTKYTPFPTTKTWNGDHAHLSTSDPRLDLFFNGFVRGCNQQKLDNLLSVSWIKSPEDTIKIILHSRDCRKGKGEKDVSYKGMLWLRKNKPLTYLLNLQIFLEHGYYKDLLQLAAFAHDQNLPPLGFNENYIEIELFSEYLKADEERLYYDPNASISLASKWAPSENKYFDKRYGFAKDIATLLYPNYSLKTSLSRYRNLLSTLRSRLNLIETLAAEGKWSEINYSHVPAKAHKLLRKAFLKHCPTEYKEYLDKLNKKDTLTSDDEDVKINITGLHPHELVKHYLNSEYTGISSSLNDLPPQQDDTIEAMWTKLVETTRENGSLNNTIAISDVSGSMNSNGRLPMQVSIALGILIAQCCTGVFNKKLISFSESPRLHALKGTTLRELVEYTKRIDWAMNTNLDAVFKLILDHAKLTSLDSKDMIKNIIIISDMQFDSAVNNSKRLTAFQRANKMFKDAGYTLPKICFWNVNGEIKNVPITTHESGAFLISGFSAQLLKDLVNNGFDCDPINFLLNVISKYEVNIDESEK